MKILKMMCVLLAVLMLAGFVGGVSAAEISRVDVTIDKPETGESPDTSATVSQSTVTIKKVEWSPTVSSSGTFDADTEYTVIITAETSSSNKFSQSLIAEVNDHTASKSLSLDNKTATIRYTFSKTDAAAEVSEIEIKNLDTPKAGAAPDKTATADSDEGGDALEISSISWSPDDSYFQLDEEYTVTIKVTPKSKEYKFASSVTAEIGSTTLTSSQISKSGDTVTLTYKYPSIEPLGKITTMNLGINAPSVGKTPSSQVNEDPATFDAFASWSPSETFLPDKSYTVTVTINAKYGYLMDTSLNANVNGATAYVERISDTQARVTYTFGQITSVDSVEVGFTAPASGEKAQTSTTSIKANTGTTNSATIKWTPQLAADGTFESGVEYTAEVTFSVAGNVVFDKDTTVKINGNTVKDPLVSQDGKSITVLYTFPKTSFIPNPIEVIKEFFNLMLLMVNPASYAF